MYFKTKIPAVLQPPFTLSSDYKTFSVFTVYRTQNTGGIQKLHRQTRGRGFRFSDDEGEGSFAQNDVGRKAQLYVR